MGKTPFYAKLRAEATRELLQTGAGKLYLGFHLDPIYHVHWNNLVAPIEYETKSPDGTTVTPASGEGPQVKEASDIDPREFLVDVEGGNASESLELTVRYFACNDAEGWCIPVTQKYAITLEPDPDGGQRRAPSTGGRAGSSGGRAGMVARLMEGDRNGDGKIGKDELPERMQARFDAMDRNGDGFIDQDELKNLAERMGRGRPGGRGRPDPPENR